MSELDDDSLWKPADGPERDEWNQRDLRNARIDHNDSSQNTAGLDAAGPGKRVQVQVDHNRSRQDTFGIAVQNSTGSATLENEITTATMQSILIGGGNEGLRIDANSIRGGITGVRLDQGPFFDKFPLPSTRLVVSRNDTRNPTAGILGAAGNLSDSLVSGNVTSDNSGNGIILLAGNTGMCSGPTKPTATVSPASAPSSGRPATASSRTRAWERHRRAPLQHANQRLDRQRQRNHNQAGAICGVG